MALQDYDQQYISDYYSSPERLSQLASEIPRYQQGFLSGDPQFANYWQLYGAFPVNGSEADKLAWMRRAATGGMQAQSEQHQADELQEGKYDDMGGFALAALPLGAMTLGAAGVSGFSNAGWGAGAEAAGLAAGIDPAAAAGAMGGAAGQAGGGLTLAEAAGGSAGGLSYSGQGLSSLGELLQTPKPLGNWMPDDSSTYWTDLSKGTVGSGLGGAAASAATGALGRILKGNATADDWLSVLGAVAPSLIGAYGANQKANTLEQLASQTNDRWRESVAMGAPYRKRLEDLYANPSGYLSSPEVTTSVDQGTAALARALSTSGNPFGSGRALSEMQNYASNQLFGRLGQEKDRLAGFGGLTAYNQAGAQGPNLGMSLASLESEGDVYNALGIGLDRLLNPRANPNSFNINLGTGVV